MRKIPTAIPVEITNDPKLAALVEKHGIYDLKKYHGGMNTFQALFRSIIYQQLSGKAADTIHRRLRALFPNKRPNPEFLLTLTDEQLRGAGLSRGKVLYVRDLAQKFVDGTIPRSFKKMTNEEIIENLTKIKGIGEWTVHMFLIFTLHRPDVLPVGDLAIRKGFQKVYGLRKMPDAKQMEKIAKSWRNHASVASWYLWRSIDD